MPGGLEATPSGRLFIRNLAMRFDNQLAPVGVATPFMDDLVFGRTNSAIQAQLRAEKAALNPLALRREVDRQL